MSASIRIEILGGTDIMYAYADCLRVSLALGGISVETTFNGVEMFYHGQRPEQWWNEFHERIGATRRPPKRRKEAASEREDQEPGEALQDLRRQVREADAVLQALREGAQGDFNAEPQGRRGITRAKRAPQAAQCGVQMRRAITKTQHERATQNEHQNKRGSCDDKGGF